MAAAGRSWLRTTATYFWRITMEATSVTPGLFNKTMILEWWEWGDVKKMAPPPPCMLP